jgi:large subunit ribosomal protein L9
MMVQITRKTGVDGRLFGSVSAHDIIEALDAQGFKVDKGAVRLPEGPLKTIGDTHVQIALHSDVVANVTVSVLGEQ